MLSETSPRCTARNSLGLMELKCILPGGHKYLIAHQLERFLKQQRVGAAPTFKEDMGFQIRLWQGGEPKFARPESKVPHRCTAVLQISVSINGSDHDSR